jgi:hypothetical protein
MIGFFWRQDNKGTANFQVVEQDDSAFTRGSIEVKKGEDGYLGVDERHHLGLVRWIISWEKAG